MVTRILNQKLVILFINGMLIQDRHAIFQGKSNIMMKTKSCFIAVIAILLGACTTMSGPKYWTNQVTLADGSEAYKVSCAGILSGADACMKQARKICKDQVVNVEIVDGLKDKYVPKRDSREIVFQCGVPLAEEEAPLAPERITTSNFQFQSDALFEIASAKLSDQAKAKFDEFAKTVSAIPLKSLKIIGHTDSKGSNAYNQGLSERRAQSVLSYLTFLGVKADSVKAEGRGEEEPIATNDTAEGRATNRRVDIEIQGGSTTTEQ